MLLNNSLTLVFDFGEIFFVIFLILIVVPCNDLLHFLLWIIIELLSVLFSSGILISAWYSSSLPSLVLVTDQTFPNQEAAVFNPMPNSLRPLEWSGSWSIITARLKSFKSMPYASSMIVKTLSFFSYSTLTVTFFIPKSFNSFLCPKKEAVELSTNSAIANSGL